MKQWEVERLFNDDIREKRKAGSGSFHRRGKGVKHGISGALRTPSYYMSAKEKKKLNGEVRITQMYETIIPITEFELKEESIQKAMLTRWREIFSNEKIKKELGVGNSRLYNLMEELGLPKKPRGGTRGPRKARVPNNSAEATLLDFEVEPKEIQKEIQAEVVKTLVISKGLHLEYNGKYDVDSLNRLFTKLQLMIDGDTCNYNISLTLTEIDEKN